MMRKEINWYQNPTKKTLRIFGLLWLIGNTLLILALTDLFTESPLKVTNIIMMFFMIGSTVSVSHLYIKYYKKNKIK